MKPPRSQLSKEPLAAGSPPMKDKSPFLASMMYILLKISVTAFYPWQPFLQVRTSLELCYHNLFSFIFNIYKALAPAWNSNTTSLFYHGTTWECYTWWNHILPYVWTTCWGFTLWPLVTKNSPIPWDHILLPCTPKFPKPHVWIPTSCMEWPATHSHLHLTTKCPQLNQGSECHHQLHLDIMSNPYCFTFTYKKFPENSASWLVYSPGHPQRMIVITRDAYFEKTSAQPLPSTQSLLLELSPSALI